MRKRNLFSSLFWFCIGVLFIVGSFKYPAWDGYGPGPGFFPLLLGILFCFLSLIEFWVNLIRKRDEGKKMEESDSLKFSKIKKTIIFICLLFCFCLLFTPLGFLLTILFFMIGVLFLFYRKSIRLSLSISFFTALLTYIIFVKVLGISLPGGVLKALIPLY